MSSDFLSHLAAGFEIKADTQILKLFLLKTSKCIRM